jgi:hypothetical protein
MADAQDAECEAEEYRRSEKTSAALLQKGQHESTSRAAHLEPPHQDTG